MKYGLLLALLALLAASDAVGAAIVGAVVAGTFTVLNTVLNAVLLRRMRVTEQKVDRTRLALEAPRRVLYDNAGKPIGTMLDLETEEGWSVSTHRRQTDPDEPGFRS